ncbi:hypothetical protein B1R32_10521 [Abditibacterium utsteinense]|uniref:Type II secretory pathway, pseudopilin PulG n=1 Tax=Abditibacterium utsteinense TaxID=1960156 RepID=A0A2S8SU77_9BACT|nr:hypothetical protein [Abditibacterium utsteinense]PQV64340.1 hypothetical protein B1R32_10521 [Abditibacterium utsteinense]
MNKKLILLIAVILSIPVIVFAQNKINNMQRIKRAQLMQKTLGQAQSLSLAIRQYSFDNKGNMPPMNNLTALKQALKPYLGGSDFISAASGKPFIFNTKLSGKKLVDSNFIVWLYDPKPTSGPNNPKDLYRVVGYSNHFTTMPEKIWQSEKKTFGLP